MAHRGGPEAPTTADTRVPFPQQQSRYAESLTWPLQTFNLPENPRERVKIGRVIVGVSECNGGSKVYVTTDVGVEVLSQREIETGIRVKDPPVVPGQTRQTLTRYASMDYQRIWVGEDIAVDFVGKEDGVVSFCLRSPTAPPPEDIRSNRSFNEYPV